MEPEHMPVDEAGNRADIVMDPNSTVSRMNLGRLYEQYINASGRDTAKYLRNLFGVAENDTKALAKVQQFKAEHPDRYQTGVDYLLGFYKITSPQQFVWFTSGAYPAPFEEHMASVLAKGIYLYMPPDNDPESETIITELEQHYRPTYGPVSYVGNSGLRRVTKDPVRIGSVYTVVLEKTADDWTAVSSCKLQHHGVPSQVTNADKYSQPTRIQAVRALGESEVRIYASYVGPQSTAEIMDRSNNPASHKEVLKSILHADHPTNIAVAVDREKVPLGGAKPQQLVSHMASCAGWKFVYQPYQPSWLNTLQTQQ